MGASFVQCLRFGQVHVLKYVHFEKTKKIKYSPSTIWIYIYIIVAPSNPIIWGWGWIIGGARKFLVFHFSQIIRILAYRFIHNTFRNCFWK